MNSQTLERSRIGLSRPGSGRQALESTLTSLGDIFTSIHYPEDFVGFEVEAAPLLVYENHYDRSGFSRAWEKASKAVMTCYEETIQDLEPLSEAELALFESALEDFTNRFKKDVMVRLQEAYTAYFLELKKRSPEAFRAAAMSLQGSDDERR